MVVQTSVKSVEKLKIKPMWILRGCPHCKTGDLELDFTDSDYYTCLQCGYIKMPKHKVLPVTQDRGIIK